MSQIKKLLDIYNYDAYIQDMIFGIADQWEEHIKEEEFLQLLNEMPPVTEEERVLQERNKEEFEDLPF